VDVVRSGFGAFAHGGVEALLPHLTDDVTWTVRSDLPDAGTYRGHDGVRRLIARFAEVLEDMQFQPQEFIDAGDRVVVPLEWWGRGSASGAAVAERQGETWVFTLRGQQVCEVREYARKAEALEAVNPGCAQETETPPID
jgi:uncharacterized protein